MLKKILTAPTEELGKWSRFAIFQLKLWRQCTKLLKQNRSGQQAAALSYHTLFGIVPLAIITLMVFQSFRAYQDVGTKVRRFLYEQVHLSKIEYTIKPQEGQEESKIKLTDKIDEITEKFIADLDTRAIGGVSAIIVFWAAIGLLTTIERAFNNIWHVSRGRSFVHRMINYWALITLGPLLLGIGIYVSTHYLAVGGFQQGVMNYIRPVLPYIISVAALFFLYFVMPNTEVSARSALWGAAVAALIWTVAKFLFQIYVTKFIPFSQVYGVMGLVPLGVFWIFVTWWIVLFGLQLTFATQHLKSLDAAELAKMHTREEHFVVTDFTVIKMLGYILAKFEEKDAPVTAEVICSKLDLPADFGEKILDHLTEEGLLFRTSEPQVGFVPATDGGNITLAEISDAVAKASFGREDEGMPEKLKGIIQDQHQKLGSYTLKDILQGGQVSIKESNQELT